MRIACRTVVLTIAVLALAAGNASAQMGMGMHPPQFKGVWNPVVGSGAAYRVDSKESHNSEMEVAVVGTETVDGKPGYWMEMTMKDPRMDGTVYMKNLVVLDGKNTRMRRMIMQAPGQPPMEFPLEMMQRGQTQEQHADIREQAERLGTESVTTLAGTFTCEHYRLKDGSGDVWVSDKVAPWGVVKMTGRDSNMTLVRVITNAKTHITGTPQKFDPMEMMRRQQPPN
jgi:hypothetical protein